MMNSIETNGAVITGRVYQSHAQAFASAEPCPGRVLAPASYHLRLAVCTGMYLCVCNVTKTGNSKD